MRHIAIVIPCFNEAHRLDQAAFARFSATQPGVRFVLVDDGSTDGTADVLEDLSGKLDGHAEVLRLERNTGKAEAVRRGVLRAFDGAPRYVGYWDADLSTPLEAIPEFEAVLEERPDVEVVFGARVRLLGRQIDRRAVRHYPGRVFATAASLVLRLPVYDTQCGAKLFRGTPETRALFAEPFVTSWVFDVELIARMLAAPRAAGRPPVADVIYELPLVRWQDVRGSKIKPRDYVRAARDLLRIRRRYLT